MRGELTPVQQLRRRGRVQGSLPFVGPAFVAAIAYVDPGNFATNISGGTEFGYLLFGIPLLPAGLITAVVAFALLGLQSRGYRRYEIVRRGCSA